MRKVCNLELRTAKRIRSFLSVREEEVWHVIESIRLIQSCNERLISPIDISEMIFSSTNHMICRSTFGRRFKDQDALILLVNKLVALSGGFDVADLFPSWKLLHHLS